VSANHIVTVSYNSCNDNINYNNNNLIYNTPGTPEIFEDIYV